jgi:neurofibromin 1
MAIVMAMCEVCPPAEVDAMNSVLLNLFDTRASLMSLLKLMIDREIAHAGSSTHFFSVDTSDLRLENDASLFRGNSACTKFLSAFAKIHGYNYLRSLIIPLVKTMSAMPRGHAYDLDPTKVSEQDLYANQRSVELVASSFLEIVSSSVPALPL